MLNHNNTIAIEADLDLDNYRLPALSLLTERRSLSLNPDEGRDWSELADLAFADAYGYLPATPATNTPGTDVPTKSFKRPKEEQGLTLTDKFARMRAEKNGIALVEPHSVRLPKLKAKTFLDSLPGGGVGLCTYDENGLVVPLEGNDLPIGLTCLEELRIWQHYQEQLTTAPVSLAAVDGAPEVCKPLSLNHRDKALESEPFARVLSEAESKVEATLRSIPE